MHLFKILTASLSFTGLIAASPVAVSKRELTRPEPGQLDAWFQEQFSPASGFSEFEYTQYDDNGDKIKFTSNWWALGDTPFQIGTKGLSGCVVIVVQSSAGLYLGHIWDSILREYADGRTGPYAELVLPSLESSLGGHGYSIGSQPELKIRLLVPSTTGGNYGPKYPDFGEMLKSDVSRLTDNYPVEDILQTWYYSHETEAGDLTTANGKSIATYGTNADGGGEKGFALWMGSMFNENGRIPNEDVTDPIHNGRF